MNDDTVIVTPNWAIKLVETLALNPYIPNFGVTGPSDSNNDKIFTHGFVHRTHLEVRFRLINCISIFLFLYFFHFLSAALFFFVLFID